MTPEEKLEKATQWLRDADGLLITARAGMGVDSGLPDFRGAEGFWRAYRSGSGSRTGYLVYLRPNGAC